jgi:hypothetical protein
VMSGGTRRGDGYKYDALEGAKANRTLPRDVGAIGAGRGEES